MLKKDDITIRILVLDKNNGDVVPNNGGTYANTLNMNKAFILESKKGHYILVS